MKTPSGIPINKVFTPRQSDVNEGMYIERPRHERDLIRAVDGSMHVILSGASGTGKTWLCKKVAKSSNWAIAYTNCANADRVGSITAELFNTLVPNGDLSASGQTDHMKGGVNIGVINSGVASVKQYDVKTIDPLERALTEFGKRNKNKRLIIILDNLEALFNSEELIDELGNIILLLDDIRFSKLNVKFLLVGTQGEVREYYHKVKNMESIANRLKEILPLRVLSTAQVKKLIINGFRNNLGVKWTDDVLDTIAQHVYDVSLGMAMMVHEYSEILAHICSDHNWTFKRDLLNLADQEFMQSSLQQSYSVIEACMNTASSKIGRRNQVLITIGNIGVTEFTAEQVKNRLSEIFKKTGAKVSKSNVAQMLADLSSDKMNLLKKVSKTNCYTFADPRYVMCLRAMLFINADESIGKRLLAR